MTDAMSTASATAEGTVGTAHLTALYVYGIVPADTPVDALDEDTGMAGNVRLLGEGAVAAVVEPVDPERPLGRRRDLLAHSTVLNQLATRGPVLPMRFGSVLDSEEAVVAELLRPHQDHFAAMLEQVRDKVQFTLRVRYVLDSVLAEVVSENAEVARLREQTAGQPEEATHYERIRLGEIVAKEVDVRRRRDAAAILNGMAPHAERVAEKETGGMDGLLDASFLVPAARQAEFEQAAEALAEEWDGRARVSLIGPTALFDFVDEE